VRRIYPVYLFALLISCLLNGINGNWPSFTDLTVHVLLLHGFSTAYFNSINLVLWTISVEAFFYIIYPLWLKYRLKAGLVRAFCCGTLLSAVCCALTAAYFYPYSLPARWFFLNTWGGWLLGALLAETIETNAQFYRSWKWWGMGGCAWTFGLVAGVGNLYHGHLLIAEFPVGICLCAWPLVGLVLAEKSLCSSRGIIGKAVACLSGIGLASYSVYLLHEPLITLRNLVQNQIPFGYLRMPFQIAWFFVILGISWLSYRYLELRFIRTGTTKRQAAPNESPSLQSEVPTNHENTGD
jgi:peptidoglycan/LPS O-acetylase OafA/YrhL